ncbi:uncharacterized protein N0V89_001429 [Didymosphaeria variabile]|uniref:Uncharacterized protein n=1 Tax=Didymosphaeria variabile TaxID=1932322 RepID=A0A9W8XW47_9PLEO|nr:uncharacterized protein N0V89_001429 [Didymosphaeria variabile]KAJ4360862.1 hypothetical protein N0V89_001429 [Didymosphaeria variabile]
MDSTMTNKNTKKMSEPEKPPMKLLELPPEIFKDIIHEIVANVGPGEALKMRSTCRTFAGNILHELCSNYSWTYSRLHKYAKFAEDNMSSILFNQTERLAGAHPDLPNKIIAMADWISHEQDDRYPNHPWFDVAKSPLNYYDKLAVAAEVGNTSLVKPLISKSDFRAVRGYQIFGDGLRIAATMENLEFVQIVSDYLDAIKGDNSSDYQRLIHYLRHGDDIDQYGQTPLVTAIEYGDRDIVTAVLNAGATIGGVEPQYLKERTKKTPPVVLAAELGKEGTVEVSFFLSHEWRNVVKGD